MQYKLQLINYTCYGNGKKLPLWSLLLFELMLYVELLYKIMGNKFYLNLLWKFVYNVWTDVDTGNNPRLVYRICVTLRTSQLRNKFTLLRDTTGRNYNIGWLQYFQIKADYKFLHFRWWDASPIFTQPKQRRRFVTFFLIGQKKEPRSSKTLKFVYLRSRH